MKEYYIDHPDKNDYEFKIPKQIVNTIIKDYMSKTYYWTVGILCAMIGFIIGISI